PHGSSAQQVLDAHAAALLDGKWLAARALDHCPIAQETIRMGVEALGWALASAATLVAPEVIVVGGGIASMPDPLFWPPLRRAFETNVFAPLKGHVRLSATALGADSVVFGAVEAARRSNV
ncbi:MAG: ROK family protein, partial [Bacteroidetes bacterium]|nr:ROK family protein [Bacteroidota bacterium]